LLDGFEGKLTTGKWATIAKSSTDTALRDINELVSHGLLRRTEGGGRSTGYEIAPFD
jgi:Fic family protein